MHSNTSALLEKLTVIRNLHRAQAVLDWDMQVNMPSGAANSRGDQLATLTEITHAMETSSELGALLSQAEESINSNGDFVEQRIVEVARRDFDVSRKIPADLAVELSRHTALSQEVWATARRNNDFKSFEPYLEKSFELSRQMAEAIGYEIDIYDALLDRYEEGSTRSQVTAMYDGIKPALIQLNEAIKHSKRKGDDSPLAGPFPIESQSAATLELVGALGYDFNHGRQDIAAHPFCTNFGRNDVRITTRFNPDRLEQSVYASLHETGHALYELGIPEELDNTPLCGGCSMGIHESQSRLWENMVGRSRAFVTFALPKLKKHLPSLENVTEDRFFRAVNCVEPSFIRVEADEVTYNLHVLIRFELEAALLNRELKVQDLPGAWNEKMRDYLGLTPPTDTLGVLQDVHWSAALIGYFPTYSLGNIISGQLWHSLVKELGDVDELIATGQFAPILNWLRTKIHSHGRLYRPSDLVAKATGEPLNSTYYKEYLLNKYSAIYEL